MKKFKTLPLFYCFFTGLIIASLIKIFVFEAMTVDGVSMQPALTDQQTIYINKAAYGISNPFGSKLLLQWAKPKENDIIIYLYNNNIVVKRCVALENTPLDYLTNSGYILIVNSDKKIPLTREQYYNMHNCSEVPSGYILAIGDNFENSFDSRNYGFIPVSNVLGKVICR